MFKRVEKRQRRKEELDALGLTEEMKEIMGVNDTDSDESQSESGDESNIEESRSDSQDFAISIQEALRDPLYLISLEPLLNSCVVCPGKTLKNDQMIKIHANSNAHKRRFKQFETLVEGKDPQANAFEYLPRSKILEEKNVQVSKRKQKRADRIEKFRQKRARKRAAKEAAAEPPKKKSRTEKASSSSP